MSDTCSNCGSDKREVRYVESFGNWRPPCPSGTIGTADYKPPCPAPWHDDPIPPEPLTIEETGICPRHPCPEFICSHCPEDAPPEYDPPNSQVPMYDAYDYEELKRDHDRLAEALAIIGGERDVQEMRALDAEAACDKWEQRARRLCTTEAVMERTRITGIMVAAAPRSSTAERYVAHMAVDDLMLAWAEKEATDGQG